MTISSFEQFAREAIKDPALQQRLQAITDRDSLVKLAVELASERGYSFTAQDVEVALEHQARVNSTQADEELSDEALEAVAGGKVGWCSFGGGGSRSGNTFLLPLPQKGNKNVLPRTRVIKIKWVERLALTWVRECSTVEGCLFPLSTIGLK